MYCLLRISPVRPHKWANENTVLSLEEAENGENANKRWDWEDTTTRRIWLQGYRMLIRER
jgi:hypothetical protein